MELKDLKYKIKALRVGQGIGATEFAKELGISREYLRLIENGRVDLCQYSKHIFSNSLYSFTSC